jgi:5-methylcytosine-specific restriction enzyme subunit McrC
MARRANADRPVTSPPATLHLTEYQAATLTPDQLAPELGLRIWRRYGRQIQVEFPSPQTEGAWRLTSQGWVGLAPVTPALLLAIAPRVPVDTLFTMLDYAWDLRSFHLLDGLAAGATVGDAAARLAHILARRVIALAQRGFVGAYHEHTEARAALRGRLDISTLARRPWQPQPTCTFADYTRDTRDHRALLWTLHTILHSPICTPAIQPTVRQAYRALAGVAALTPISVADLDELRYHRLNDDYRPLHALCRFFLSHTGPALGEGSVLMLPFLVNMARLFERFVAAWLAAHVPETITIQPQVRIPLADGRVTFVADGVWRDRATGAPRGVFDTKYLADPQPATDAIAQVVAYARAVGCHAALLIAPVAPTPPLDLRVGDIRVRALAFPLAGDLDATGQEVLAAIVRG